MPRERATRASWKTEPPPCRTAALKVAFTLTDDEYNHLRYGFVPQKMEDKWRRADSRSKPRPFSTPPRRPCLPASTSEGRAREG